MKILHHHRHISHASSSRSLLCIADFLKWETLHAFALGKTQMFLCILQKPRSFWKEYTGYCHLTCIGKMKKIIVRMWFLWYAAWKTCLLCLAKFSFWNMTVCLIYFCLYAQDCIQRIKTLPQLSIRFLIVTYRGL